MNVRKLILLLATGCLATAALAQTPAEFKEMTDSLKARIQRRTTVRNGEHINAERILKLRLFKEHVLKILYIRILLKLKDYPYTFLT